MRSPHRPERSEGSWGSEVQIATGVLNPPPSNSAVVQADVDSHVACPRDSDVRKTRGLENARGAEPQRLPS